MDSIYRKAYTEVLEILKYLPKEEYDKIPTKEIAHYKENMDREYVFKLDPTIDLGKQNISKEANAVLVTIFRDYFATDKQKKTLNILLSQNQEKLEEMKREKYNIDNLFKREKQEDYNEDNTNSKIQLVEYNEGFIIKFIDFIKKLLRLK